MAVLDRELTDIETGANDRLIVQMPPRHGKSFLTSGYFPAHYLGMFPERNVIMCGATADLALEFSGMARDLLTEHGWMFGVKVRKDRSARDLWQLEQGGICRAAGVGGAVMGRGADLLIIDDYFKDVEDALSETMRTKLYQWYLSTSGTRRSPKGAIVVMATRWHGKDLIGQILNTAEQTGEKWRVVNFPALGDDGAALWPEVWPASLLEKIRSEKYASGYPWIWEALYQQNPPDVLDAEWPPEYFDNIWFDEWPDDSEQVWRVMSLDPSLGGGSSEKLDYSAFIFGALSKDGIVYIDADIARRDIVQQVDRGLHYCDTFKPQVWAIEVDTFGAIEALVRHKALGMMPPIATIRQHKNKIGRIKVGLTDYLARKMLRFKRRSSGTALLVEQLKGFPSHKFDDGPDALEMALRIGREMGNPLPRLPEMVLT